MGTKKIAVFLALAFGLAWSLAFGFFAAGGRLNSAAFIAMGIGYMLTPAIAAVVTQKLFWKESLRDLGLRMPRWRWMLIGWFLPLLLVLIALGFSLLVPGVELATGLAGLYDQLADKLSPQQLTELHQKLDHSFLATPGVLPIFGIVQILIAGASINAVVALGEELGWRGLLTAEFSSLGFWRSSLLIGFIWGIWHLPLIVRGYNYPGHPVLGPIMMTFLTVFLSPLIGYVRLRARSVFAAAVFHGTFNAAAGLVLLLRGGDATTVGITGIAGLSTLCFAGISLWCFMPDPGSPGDE